jgi:hypothetical protein
MITLDVGRLLRYVFALHLKIYEAVQKFSISYTENLPFRPFVRQTSIHRNQITQISTVTISLVHFLLQLPITRVDRSRPILSVASSPFLVRHKLVVMPINARPIWIPLNAVKKRLFFKLNEILHAVTVHVFGIPVQKGHCANEAKDYNNIFPAVVTSLTLD